VPNYPGFLLLGVALWNFFSEGTTNGASSLLARADLLTKTVVPRPDHGLFGPDERRADLRHQPRRPHGRAQLTGTPFGMPALLFPLLLVDLVLLTLGMALRWRRCTCAIATSAIYGTSRCRSASGSPPSSTSTSWCRSGSRWIVWVNPVGRIIGDSRRALIYGWWPGPRGLILTTLMSIAVCVIGYAIFRRMQGRLVEHF
jgi:hypothetical protein